MADSHHREPGESPAPVRHYHVGELVVIMVAFALTALALEPDGLLIWAQRLPVGRRQTAAVAVIEPMAKLFDSPRVPRPRQALIAAGDRLQEILQKPLVEAREEPDEALAAAEPPPSEPSEEGEEMDAGSEEATVTTDAGVAEAPAEVASQAGPEAATEDAGAPEEGPKVTTVLLVGDSMMKTGLSGAIKRALADDETIRIVRANQEATGLSRPDVFDWTPILRPLVENERPAVVICTFGANDAQTIRENGHDLEFGTPDWDATYRHRAVDMMGLLAHRGADVLWLGLPRMRSSEFDSRMRHLNDIFQQIAGEVPHTHYLESSTPITCDEDAYCTYQHQGDKLVKVRLDDGIHYTPAGGDRVARRVVDWIREQARARAHTTVSLAP